MVQSLSVARACTYPYIGWYTGPYEYLLTKLLTDTCLGWYCKSMETEPLCPSCGRPKDAGNIHGDWCDDTHEPEEDCDDYICKNRFHKVLQGKRTRE